MPYATLPDGTRLHYVDHSPSTGGFGAPPLVMLHGLGCSSADWDMQLPAFHRQRRLIMPCLRGFGRSDKPAEALSIAGLAADVLALLDLLNLSDAHLLGYSMGGAVALQATLDAPERIESLTLVNSQASFELHYWREQLHKLHRIGMASERGLARMTRLLNRHCFPEPHQRALREEMTRRHLRNHKPSYLAAIQALSQWSVASRLEELRLPMLVVSGDQDYVPPQERRKFVRQLRDARLVVVGDSRHATPFDQPDAFNRAVLTFLEEVEARGGRRARRVSSASTQWVTT